MWMMGYHDDFNMPVDSFNGRKLRPLIPRPAPSSSSASPTPPCITRIHAPDHFFALNHHLASMAEQGKRELGNMGASSVVVSSRWNPTPEQLRTLEELYRRGTRTPSADQIQHITAQLRRYGKIEGKNVFYWFQNHKARERQKRRRQMECPNNTTNNPQDHDMLQTTKDNNSISSLSGGGSSRVAGVEVEGEQNKNCSTHVHCTTTQPEEANSKAATGMAECTRDDGWVQFEHRELQQHIMMRRNATWQQMQLPCPLPPPRVPSTRVPSPTILPTINNKRLSPHHHHQQDYLNIFIHNNHHQEPHDLDQDQGQDRGSDRDQTLELFPLRSESAAAPDDDDDHCTDQKSDPNHSNQFFEFLPLKN